MKTKRKSDARFSVQVIGLDRVTYERLRASLRGGPFHFLPPDSDPAEPPDLYVVAAARREEVAHPYVPVIACGPARLLRSALLGKCADYLREPWTPDELSARAFAALERRRGKLSFPWGRVSLQGKDLRTPRGLVPLTLQQSRILKLLLRARGEPVPRSAIAGELWGIGAAPRGRAVDVHVAAIRRKLRGVEPRAGRFILSVRKQGYMIP